MEKRITSILSSDSNIKILTPFSQKAFFNEGKIEINYKGVSLIFEVLIPKYYPFTLPTTDNISIIFKNVDLIGFSHINNDGSVCFHPQKDDDFERKLKSEIIGLKKWIYDYYICRKEDDNYTYLIHNVETNKSSTLIFSDNDKKFSKDDFGVFEYSNLTNYTFKTESIPEENIHIQTFFRIGFGKNYEDKWSIDFLERLKSQQYKGFWVYIESEPIVDEVGRRKGTENWNQLEKYLPKDFVKYLYRRFKDLNKNFFFEGDLYLLVGYKIPNNHGYETHWDLIKIHKNKLPIETVLVPKEERIIASEKYVGICTSDYITWGSTINSNYERFFGRGKLSENLINSRVLIIGCGALGSSLSEILVRGGCRNIMLDDFDIVSSGNLCRSKYNLLNINTRKIESLKNHLISISPYVDVYNVPFKISYYSDLEDGLNQTIDFIFDCSTDSEVTYSLDSINLRGEIFSLSITNKAKELVCVSGKDITKKTKYFYDYLGNEEPSFYEGTGCGYPTFEANFNDINSLLNLAIMNINSQIDKKSISDNFIIRQVFENGFNKLKIEGFHRFLESTTENYIYISNETIAKIKLSLEDQFPNEFGGVFVGFNQDKLVVIEDVLIPDDFENGKTIFVRHPGTLNDRLELIFKKTNGKRTYIGEWHSHPNGPATPSSTDIKAMKEIAGNEKIGNSNPTLMIVKITKDMFEPNLFLYHDKKLLKYEQQN